MLREKDLCIVLSGGGVRCGFAIGALYALARIHGICKPACMIPCSGSVGLSLYYLLERFKEMYEWPVKFADKRFVNKVRFHRIMDIDYLVDSIFFDQIPTLVEEAKCLQTRVIIPATELPSGNTKWFSNEHFDDLRLILKASKAIPGVCSRIVSIGGKDYVDGSFSTSLNSCIEEARKERPAQIIVIDNGTNASLVGSALIRMLSYKQGPTVRAIVRQYVSLNRAIDQFSGVTVCRPLRSLSVRSPLDTNTQRLRATIDQGFEAMAALRFN